MKTEFVQGPAIAVDLDGTLIKTDLLLESFLLLIKRNPLYLFAVVMWLLKGKATLKAKIASRVNLNAAALPYNTALIEWLKVQKEGGRALWLVTASHDLLAKAVAKHLGIFDGVMASDETVNLSGTRKADALVKHFGEKGFDYCGNDDIDLSVWRHGRSAIVVNASKSLEAKARAAVQVGKVIPADGQVFKAVTKALRVHQWAKNALIFVPVAAAHLLTSSSTLTSALLAFVVFSLCASSVYILNDLLDLEADRQHHSKCNRPFAAGKLSVLTGLLAFPVLLIGSFAIAALTLNIKFVLVLATYYVATVAYSFSLKRIVMVDVLMLAGLYTIRIVAGAAATSIPLSFWLLIFSIFIFLSLAMVKRYAELYAMKQRGKLSAQGRGYQVEDLHLIQSMGAASGYLSILVLALYLNSPDITVLYKHAKVAWLLVPIMLYWISRIWMQTYRGHMDDDPLVFAMKDRVSLITGMAAVAVLVAAAL